MYGTRHCTRSVSSIDGRSTLTKRTDDIQVCPVVPYRIGEVPAHGIDKDLIFIKLEDDVGKPPEAFTLYALAVAGRPSDWHRVQCPLDDVWYLNAGCKRQPSTCAEDIRINPKYTSPR